ncbi:MAG: hypothetical protein PUF11_09305 [Parafannyhessea umbonata]|uniref:hypothetical protein n=1 Tax=Parafannyhessea umbonata TaxID=604330 RepID=UPI0026EEDE31|nr:hypothetical protein [Parafannyhessea umbonata]MDD6566961.1 hypothetical protein [Parafannyhessea umbonata]
MREEDRARLLMAQSVYRECAGMVKTGSPDNLRGQLDEELESQYERTGARSVDVRVGGVTCATATRTVKAGRPRCDMTVTDERAFAEWVADNITEFYEPILAQCARSGEVPDGVDVTTSETPDTVRWQLKNLDPHAVAVAVRAVFPDADAVRLLTGGGE